MLWPRVVFVDKIDDLNSTVNQIVGIARDVDGFNEINRDDIEKMMNNYDQELTLEELEEITAIQNEPNQSNQNDEEEEHVKLEFSSK
ncbi:unnamed protein product [Macrosiphum euphorbiae]|uniref:Uncharacterized protein n=1 Tax=Macrosiphum euphorbiae TaxID=13131 RepID=A0AAV0WZ86_9HEMI|nr:unnamed protein product [Macrosiphum euphorbiae]